MNEHASFRLRIDRLQQRAFLVGLVAMTLCIGGAIFNPGQFFQSYLQAYLFWIGISLGCLAVLMLHHLVGGWWGLPIRRPLEAGCRTLSLMAVLFVPILLWSRLLYSWARAEEVAADELLRHKSLYLNVPAFTGRAIVYFAIWISVAHVLNRWSGEQDRTGNRLIAKRFKDLSGPGLVLYGLTVTFSAVDWVMSLEPHWHSTIYGMVFVAGQGLEGTAFVIIVAHLLTRWGALADMALSQRFHDLGNLTLTFLMLWAYTAFSQFLIVWAENLTDEIPWYLHRTIGGWQGMAVTLIVLQFGLPFVLLLSRGLKQRSQLLSLIAIVILFMRMVDLVWLVAPAFHPTGLFIHWLDLLTPIGMGGIWISIFVWHLKSRPLIPLHDPMMEAAREQVGEGQA